MIKKNKWINNNNNKNNNNNNNIWLIKKIK